MKVALTEIIQLATLDPDPWVLMVADILKSFPDIGSLNLDLEEQNPNVQDILGELREKGNRLPLSLALRRSCLDPNHRFDISRKENFYVLLTKGKTHSLSLANSFGTDGACSTEPPCAVRKTAEAGSL